MDRRTTLLRGLASEMDPMERIVTIEDAFELGLDTDPERHADVTVLQAREPNSEGEGGITQAELMRWGLRMSPMCNVATLHASSSRIAFTRLAPTPPVRTDSSLPHTFIRLRWSLPYLPALRVLLPVVAVWGHWMGSDDGKC